MTGQSEQEDWSRSGQHVTVVLVEDHVLVREQICSQLRATGVDVLEAVGTLQDGYRAVQEHQPAMVVVDNHLPDGLGTDLCSILTQECPDRTVVLYSAHLTWKDEENARRAGATDAVAKTFNSRELLTAIAAHTAPSEPDSAAGPPPGGGPDDAA